MLTALTLPVLLIILVNSDAIEQIRYKVVDGVPAPNNSRFTTPDYCLLPFEVGKGRAKFEQWYFDYESGKCEQFIYGGEGGNLNRFDSEFDCFVNCTGDPCRQVNVGGVFFGALMVNGKFQQCEYDGLTKNDNCPRDYYCSLHVGVCCREETHEICSLPKLEGTKTNDYSEKRRFFYYNKESGVCEPFYYNGVDGNQNRFEKKTQCDFACVKNVCQNDHPYSKMKGPIHCSMSSSNSTCPSDYNCAHVNSNTNYCCRPPTKLPTDNGSFYNVFSSAQTVSPLMLTAFGVVFAALF